VEPRRFIRSGIAASAIGHLSILAVILIFAEVHPFGSVTAETIAVDLVPPEEAPPQKAETEPPPPPPQTPPLDLSVSTNPTATPAASAPQQAARQPASPQQSSPQAPSQQPLAKQPSAQQASPQQPSAAPQQPPPASVSRPNRREANLQPPPAPQSPSATSSPPPPPPPASSSPGYLPPEPDVSVKYHVMLGLPPDIELPRARPDDRSGDGRDVATKADLASGLVAAFRRHLKTCLKLPPSISRSDDIKIRLRVLMTPQGRLAAEPVLIEASASMKGPALMQSAMSALAACQPYQMLPVDRYGEWKVLDLNFTPQDYAGAS
jgi:hypothetical protein